MAASFTLPKHVDFTFDIAGVDGEFTIPAIGKLTTEQAVALAAIVTDDKNIKKKNAKIKTFLLDLVPELTDKGLGENDYNIIFGAYWQAQDAAEAGK